MPNPTRINAYHNVSNYINLTAINGSIPTPPNYTITGEPDRLFTLSVQVQDKYGNICNSDYDGKPYVSNCTAIPGTCTQTIAVKQHIFNATGGSWDYNAITCSQQISHVPGTTPCFAVMNASEEGIHKFTLYSYPFPLGTVWTGINNTIEEATVTSTTVTPNPNMNYSYYNTLPSPDPVWALYNYTIQSLLSTMAGFSVTMMPTTITVGHNFTINVSAILSNGSVNTDYPNTTLVSIYRLPRPEQPTLLLIATIYLTNGTNSTFVNATLPASPNSLNDFNKSGFYVINASDGTFTGNGTLYVSAGGINNINATQIPNPVFRTLPFTITAIVQDIGNNPVTNYSGEMNISCPTTSVNPPTQSVFMNSTSNAQFVQIANETGAFDCNLTALDPVSGTLITQNFTIHILEPYGCVNFSIEPNPITAPPLDNIVNTSNSSPVNDVMKHNYNIAGNLIGWDGTKMKGNFSICLESYYVGRACFNGTDIQFDKAPVSVCVKEFVYNPQADERISDHLNYNGIDDFDATFKRPEVLWGWGYKNFSGTVSACSMDGNGMRYNVNFIPGTMYTDYFNITVALPLTVLAPYNITNDTRLNPHELLGYAAVLVLDEKSNGRLAKFDTSSPANWLEDYTASITGSNAQAITYDNRGNIYVALSNKPKILVLQLVKAYEKTIYFIKEMDVVTKDGKVFFPYGLDTDSWGNLYVVGNTDPDVYDNQMCINTYSRNPVTSVLQLNASNNCCDYGDCSQTWQGTVMDIAAQEDGGAFYIARDKHRTSSWGIYYWEGYPYIGEYNASNPSQNLANISIFGEMSSDLYIPNPTEYLLQGPCLNDNGDPNPVINPKIVDKGEWHYLRGLKYRSGYLFILDYMAPDHRSNCKFCNLCSGGCCSRCCIGCCIPNLLGGCLFGQDDTHCNFCGGCDTDENQKTRIIAMDLNNYLDKPYIARTLVEPEIYAATRAPMGIPTSVGLQITDESYLTHGIDVDEYFNVYIALKGKNNGVVHYVFQPGVADPTLTITGVTSTSSFQRIEGYNPTVGTFTYLVKPSDVSQPDDVIGYPDPVKHSMMAGVSCEGCSRAGAITPSVCQGEIEKTNASENTNIQDMLASGSITAGTPVVHVTSQLSPIYRQNFLTTNITAYLRFDYTFQISSVADASCGPPGGTPANFGINKQLNVTAYSNDLTKLVEGGGQYFALTRPDYPEPPPNPPDTLPYLTYNYLSNRFFYKHYPLIQNVSELMGGSAYKVWMINASTRKTFQTIENGYYLYQYIATTPTITDVGPQGPIYNPQGNWTGGVWSGDVDAPQYLNPAVISPPFPQGTVPLNNTMNWTYPFKYNFSPVTLQPNPLPFTPQDAPPGVDYAYSAATNVSMVQVTIVCNTSGGAQEVYTSTITNATPYTQLGSGSCRTITGISIAGASAEAYVFIRPLALPEYNGICFESISGLNKSLCASTRAWFRDNIYPNTVVPHSSLEKDIPIPTRYPLIGEPFSPYPSSLFILPVHMSGPTTLTINGINSTINYTDPTNQSLIRGTADFTGVRLPNPLPLRGLDVTALYFRADGDLTLGVDTTLSLGATIPYLASNGWVQIAGPGMPTITGDIEKVRVITGCEDGCLLEFSNESNGANITGQIFLWKNGYAYGNASSNLSIKDPTVTSMPRRGPVQVVPTDPRNRDFMEISFISGTGYLGDSFEVYVDPELILSIDNLTAGNCTGCATDSECPGGVCNGGECEFPNVPKCRIAEHPTGPPCQESFVCPRIELSSLNESLEVYPFDKSHAAKPTQVTVVGTGITPALNLIKGTNTLTGAPGPGSSESLGGPFSDVYIVEVTNAVKGETLIFQTATTHTEVARLYIPTENYITKSSIGTILPNPRRLRIGANSTAGSTVHYTIKGTTGNTNLVTESLVGTFEAVCPLTGPSIVKPDILLQDCKFLFDPISSPQSAGSAFNIKITAVPWDWYPPVDTLVYPSASQEEHKDLCGGTALDLIGEPDTAGTCFNSTSGSSGYVEEDKLTYPFFQDSNRVETTWTCGGTPKENIIGDPDYNGVCTSTHCDFWGEQASRVIVKSDTPFDASGLNITLRAYFYEDTWPACWGAGAQPLDVKMSNNSGCLTADTEADWGNMITYSGTFTPSTDGNWHDYILNLGPGYTDIYCVGISGQEECIGGGGCHERYHIDAIGAINDSWVSTATLIPGSFVAIDLTTPLNITGFNITAMNTTPLNLSLPFNIYMSDDPNCFTGNLTVDSSPAHWPWLIPISLQATGSWQYNVVKNIGLFQNVSCLAFDSPDPGVNWHIDSVAVFHRPPAVLPVSSCTQFQGNVTIWDSDSMCPDTAGPFINGVWSGDVIVPTSVMPDAISASNPGTAYGGTSNQFDVFPVTGLSIVSFNTTQKFTHVLSIKIENADVNENFNITTIPLAGDYLLPGMDSKPEQIGIIQVVPNDFVLGFHQNISGTYIYSQSDSVEVNIPDNRSLGLHNFTFPFYDRFNNTFLTNYTIWLRQPTATILDIQTSRDPSNINLTNVYVTAQLLFQRYDKPAEKPSIPLPNQQIEIYVQNSSTTAYAACDPAVPAHCPISPEISNCSCPDWIDDPAHPGECIANPNCNQYGLVANLTTNASGQISTSFQIYGFGRRLAFAVFQGTNIYAPSIDIKPFYAGGVSIGMGSFSMLEPILVITVSLALLTFERKFNKQKKKNI
ncbi:MAG: hypothetical protein NT130_03690 [Candidatus Micrarchaeota archaeon]|nr:hypothetical protein [Candidatus Micrarchaeota archaeon]